MIELLFWSILTVVFVLLVVFGYRMVIKDEKESIGWGAALGYSTLTFLSAVLGTGSAALLMLTGQLLYEILFVGPNGIYASSVLVAVGIVAFIVGIAFFLRRSKPGGSK